MVELKHVGRLKLNGRKVLVAFRTLPGDADYCLVVQTENLTDSQHDALIRVVESSAAQQAYEFGEVLARSSFPDGSIMLANLHSTGRLMKVKTDEVYMTPTVHTSIALDELNQIIAEQRGCSINDLAIPPETPLPPNVEVQNVAEVADINPPVESLQTDAMVLTDEMLANKYRADADRLFKEAEELRRMANELVPVVEQTISEPVIAAKPVAKPAAKKPATKPAAKATAKTAAKPAAKATAKPAAKTPVKSTGSTTRKATKA